MPFTIETDAESDRPYVVSIRDSETGEVYSGSFVYSLGEGRRKRDTIYIHSPSFPVPRDDRAKFIEYRDLVSATKNRTATVKLLAMDAVRQPNRFPYIRPTVYNRGPVPAFQISGSFEAEDPDSGDPAQYKLVIFPKIPTYAHDLWGQGTALDEFNAYTLDFPTLMKQYLEDATANLVRIAEHLPISRGIRRAKDVETILSESIGGKLDRLIPRPESYRAGLKSFANSIEHERAKFFQEKTEWLYSTKISRYRILFFLNEFYGLFPLVDRRSYYAMKAQNVREEFGKILGEQWANSFEPPKNLQLLEAIHEAYVKGEPIPQFDPKTQLWIRNLREFVHFLSALREYTEADTPKESTYVFLSHQFGVPASEAIADSISLHCGTRIPALRCIRAKGRGGEPLLPFVKSGIWYSDSVLTIAPVNANRPDGRDPATYNWLALEAEFGRRLGKNHGLVLEAGANPRVLRDEIAAINLPPLAHVVRNPPVNRRELAEWLVDLRVRAEIPVPVPKEPPESMHILLERLAARGMESRVVGVLRGLIGMLPYTTQQTYRHVHLILRGYQEKKAVIARKLREKFPDVYTSEEEARKRFETMWKHIKERPVSTKNGPRTLIEIAQEKRDEYVSTLNKVVSDLVPSSLAGRADPWVDQILAP